MHIVDVPNCPIDGALGNVFHDDVRDAFFGSQGQWTYRQHPETGHLWLDPRPSDQSIGELYEKYYTHADEPAETIASFWQQAISLSLSAKLGYPAPARPRVLARLLSLMPSVAAAAELEVMRIHASETGRLLDVGCGGGTFLKRMRKAGWKVTGTEPDSRAAARLSAREGFPVYGSLTDLTQAEEQCFDVIVLSHVIEHLPDPLQTLIQLRSILRPHGRILITTPNALSLASRIFGSYWRGLEPPRHFNVFSPDSLLQLLTLAGLHSTRLNTDVRLARGIWYLSYLARLGGSDLESTRRSGHHLLKLAGYAFQIIENLVVKLNPTLGEEIFCVALYPNNKREEHNGQ